MESAFFVSSSDFLKTRYHTIPIFWHTCVTFSVTTRAYGWEWHQYQRWLFCRKSASISSSSTPYGSTCTEGLSGTSISPYSDTTQTTVLNLMFPTELRQPAAFGGFLKYDHIRHFDILSVKSSILHRFCSGIANETVVNYINLCIFQLFKSQNVLFLSVTADLCFHIAAYRIRRTMLQDQFAGPMQVIGALCWTDYRDK